MLNAAHVSTPSSSESIDGNEGGCCRPIRVDENGVKSSDGANRGGRESESLPISTQTQG